MNLRNWWITWRDLIQRLVALVASFASMAGLLVIFLPSPQNLPWWALTLIVIATIAFIILVVLEFTDHANRQVFDQTDEAGIQQYMHSWIMNGGRVAIWTRDLSWAQNAQTKPLLIDKAHRGELILCLPEMNKIAEDLSKAGAEVCAYGVDLLELPTSRFTIAFFGRAGSKVAIGHADGNTHIIDEFSAGAHPAFQIAEDLITLVRSLPGGADQ